MILVQGPGKRGNRTSEIAPDFLNDFITMLATPTRVDFG
jgi:hypothetical protein